ncbi:wings apart-like protein homolog [Stylophora pistillata]|uniref:wings apart-like protein homolog n=1 Tax=Stylophora pistillata TaxID=50429 RepID=UPI000C03AB72|nr:wings apart-like protein homolog [Stylophora pistillata]
MPKYGTKTYSRNRAKESKLSKEFDEIQHIENSDANVTSGQNTFSRRASRKSPWARTSRIIEKNAGLTKVGGVDSLKTGKRRRLGTIDEKDPYAFDEDDVTISYSQKSALQSNAIAPAKQTIAPEVTDKSTDDEAYSSSQEFSENSSQGSERKTTYSYKKKLTSSPFKSFLKNNDKSLSPKKDKSRRLSALPTSADFSEESQDEAASDTPSLAPAVCLPRRKDTDSPSAIRVKRTEKPLFTVVRNVKQVHECLESGEDQQFFDDVEYLLDGLKETRSISTRCISALDFASHCAQPSFRVSLRAHGMGPKIFSALQDAPSDKCLALCTSAITLMLSQDRQNADLDRSVLELMMKLLAVDSMNKQSKSLKDYNKYISKVRTLLEKQSVSEELLEMGDDDINPASLVCESLLSLASQRIGEWFKEEIRVLQGLDHIMNTELRLKLANHKFKVTIQNLNNQKHMIQYEKGSFVSSLVRLLQMCLNILNNGVSSKKAKKKPDEVFQDCFFSILKVFLNLTHNFERGCSCIGQQEGFLSSLLLTVLQLPQFVTESKRFDLLVLSLELLFNLVEDSKQNVASLVQLRTSSPCHESQDDSQDETDQEGKHSTTEALVQLFLIREEAARNTDDMTSGLSTEEESSQESFKPTKDGMGWTFGEDIDVSVDEGDKKSNDPQEEEEEIVPLEVQIGKALQKAGKHMEDSVVAAYVALLLGCILQENEANQSFVRSLLPDGDFSLLINVLRKFLRFIKLTSGTSGHGIEKIVKVLESCK